MPGSRREGMTLVELMVVVVIVGILAAIAVPAFSRYIYRSRTSEATSFLAQIRQREESYRAEFGQYACAPDDCPDTALGGYWPPSAPDEDPVPWQPHPNWDQLGARPDGQVRFRYAAIAGPPGTRPAGIGGFDGSDFWFAGGAIGDLDGDGQQITFVVFSNRRDVWVSDNAGWE